MGILLHLEKRCFLSKKHQFLNLVVLAPSMYFTDVLYKGAKLDWLN